MRADVEVKVRCLCRRLDTQVHATVRELSRLAFQFRPSFDQHITRSLPFSGLSLLSFDYAWLWVPDDLTFSGQRH